MMIFGRNVAWEYRGPHAFFHGNITLDYCLPWMLLGVVIEASWEPVLVVLISKFEDVKGCRQILPVAGALTLVFSPKMSAKAIYATIVGEAGEEVKAKKVRGRGGVGINTEKKTTRSRSRGRSPANKSTSTKKSSAKRSSSRARAMSNKNKPKFSRHERVMANFRGEGEWYPGKVTKVWGEFLTYNIAYDDGDRESHVVENWVMLEK